MKVVYFSKTGNIKRFMQNIECDKVVGTKDLMMNEPFLLLCYTTGFGEVPLEIKYFLSKQPNKENIRYVVGSGNKNWGINYCKAAHIISKNFDCELLQTFELSGNRHDIEMFKKNLKVADNE